MTKQIKKQAGESRKWRAHHAVQAKSNLSRAEYCRRQRISYHAFGYWLKKLSLSKSNELTLVPVTLEPKRDCFSGQGDSNDLTIMLPGKIKIAVGDNFSGATLTRLLNLLEAR